MYPGTWASAVNVSAFSNGIILLTMGAALLMIVFKGDVDHLISLYALGVYSFPLPLPRRLFANTGICSNVNTGACMPALTV
jgi:hypothetical protein